MICRKCEQESPEGTRFCPHCGAPLDASEQPASRPFPIVPVLASAIVLLAVVLVIVMLGNRQPQGVATGQAQPLPTANVAQGPSVPQSSQVTQGPSVPPAPSQVATGSGTKPPTPSKEVLDYLARLKTIETQRKAISNDTALGSAMYQSITSAYYGQDAEKAKQAMQGFDILIGRLQGLYTQVRSMQTPQSCLPLASSYLQVLQSHIQLVSEVKSMIQSNDIGKAMTLQNAMKGKEAADTELLRRADQELSKLCDATGAPRDFSISD